MPSASKTSGNEIVSVTVIVSLSVITAGGGTTTKETLELPWHPFWSVAVMVKANVPDCVGMPERTPAEKLIPSGSALAVDHVVAPMPPQAINVCEKELPAVTIPSEPEGETLIAGQLADTVSE